MISKRNAAKVYPRNTQVINKGDKGWTSDNHLDGRRGESFGANPLSLMDQKIRQASSREVDYSLLPSPEAYNVGDVVNIPHENGRDVVAFRLVDDERLRWRQAWVEKNGQLK